MLLQKRVWFLKFLILHWKDLDGIEISNEWGLRAQFIYECFFLLSANGFVHASSNSVEAVVAAIDSNIVPVPPPASQTYNTGPVLNITSNPGIVKFFLQLIKENFFGLQIVIITRIMELTWTDSLSGIF